MRANRRHSAKTSRCFQTAQPRLAPYDHVARRDRRHLRMVPAKLCLTNEKNARRRRRSRAHWEKSRPALRRAALGRIHRGLRHRSRACAKDRKRLWCSRRVSLEDFAEQVDAASVATTTSAHFEVGRDLLGKGKHLLIEKPIAETPAHATELAEFGGA